MKKIWFPIFCCLLLLFASWNCNKSTAATTEKRTGPPKAVPVVIAVVKQQTVPVDIRNIGTVEAYSTVAVTAQLTCQLVKAHFQEGQRVQKGDVLFSLDSRLFETTLKQVTANLEKDTVQMQNAQAEAKRKEELWKKGIISIEEKEQTRATAEALSVQVRANSAAVEYAKLQLGYCTIVSQITGRTGRLLVNEGNLVKANDTQLVLIHQLQPIRVAFAVPERELPRLQKHMAQGTLEVRAIIPETEQAEVGKLTFVDNSVDKITGSILLKAIFENKEERLWPGQFVNIVMTLANQANAIIVPSQAVQTGQKGTFVFVVKDDLTVEVRPVVVQREWEDFSIIAKGVAAQEKVVTDGQLRLVPGGKVEIKGGKPTDK